MANENSFYINEEYLASLICANCVGCEGCPILPLLHGELCIDFINSHSEETIALTQKYKTKFHF